MITVKLDNAAFELKYLLLDYTGTMSENGKLIDGVKDKLLLLKGRFERIEILTSDTFNSVQEELKGMDFLNIHIFKGKAKQLKLKRLNELGAEYCAAIGNGNNDILMLKNAALSIAVINKDGCYSGILGVSDIVSCSIIDALDILLDDKKIIALFRE